MCPETSRAPRVQSYYSSRNQLGIRRSTEHTYEMTKVDRLYADDIRNPNYYVPRAGHGKPDAFWYEGRKSANEDMAKMPYSKESFVQGFDLTPGDFYRLLDKVRSLLLVDGLYKKKKKALEAKWALHEIYATLYKDPLLQGPPGLNPPIPEYWKSKMIRKFVQNTSQSVKLNSHCINNEGTGFLKTFKQYTWKWGPGIDDHESSKYFQYRHMKIEVHSHPDNDSSGNILDLSACYGSLCDMSFLDIVVEESPRPLWEDVSKHAAQYGRLIEVIKEGQSRLRHFSPDVHELQYRHTVEDRWLSIKSDSDLSSALPLLREPHDDVMKIYVRSLKHQPESQTKTVRPRLPSQQGSTAGARKRQRRK